MIKLLADLAEILQVEDLLECSFHPLKRSKNDYARRKFHANGEDFTKELIATKKEKRNSRSHK